MARENKESKIKKMEERIASLEQALEQSSKHNAQMAQRAEDSFLNSPTYYQMQQELDFFKTIADLNQSHIDSQRTWSYRQADKVQQVFEDNKRMMEQTGGEYHIGSCVRVDEEYEKLREKIGELKGKLDGKSFNIVARDKYIQQLIEQIADLKAQNDALAKVSDNIQRDKNVTIRELVKASRAENVDKAIQSLTAALEEAQTTITELRKKNEKTLVEKNKAQMVKDELIKEKSRKYDKYSTSDEESYDSMLRAYNIVMEQLKLSNETYNCLVEKIKEQEKEIATLKEKNDGVVEKHTELLKLTSELNEKDDTVKGLYKQIEKLQSDLKQAEGKCKVIENNKQKLSERKEELTKLLGDAKQKISELESQRDAIFSRNSDPDIVTMYHQLEDRIANALISLKKSKDEAKKWKSMYQELNAQISIPVSTMKDEKPKSVGRPKIETEKIQMVLKMREYGIPMRKISSELGIALGTVSNIVKRYSK